MIGSLRTINWDRCARIALIFWALFLAQRCYWFCWTEGP